MIALQFDDGAPAAVATTPPPAAPTVLSTDDRIRDAVDRVLPAVVTVLASFPDERLADGRVLERGGIGSGIVVSDQGHIVTNFHVVAGASQITVVLGTLEQRPAVLVSDDSPFTDLAILQVSPRGLRRASFGDSGALDRGQSVVAITGQLLGLVELNYSVSSGVVSAINRSWPRNGVILEGLVQTDAPVNHGDSGGALINLDGEIVGLLTTVVRNDANGRAVEGVAFAQSSDTIRPIVEAIIAGGRFPRPRPGIERPGTQHLEISPQLALDEGLPVPFGALVLTPAPGSPADAAGMRAGDIIVAINGVAIDFDNPLPNLLKRLAPGADANLLVIRGRREFLITLSPWLE
ncbi:MAG: trypsin-like peptidase domain-containing protein [Dehalococcoidia bacterium]